jgi:hypothetical protein
MDILCACDLSTGDAYSSLAPDPSSDMCLPIF